MNPKHGHGFSNIRRLCGIPHAICMGRSPVIAEIHGNNAVMGCQCLLDRAPVTRSPKETMQQDQGLAFTRFYVIELHLFRRCQNN